MDNFIRCPLCNSDNFLIICRKAGLKRGEAKNINNVICRACGMIYNNPMPADRDLEEYYGGLYAEDRGCDGHDYNKALERIKNKQPELKSKKVIEFFKEYIKENGHVLDIGCSYGNLLAEIKKQYNCHVKGIEPDSTFIKVAREYYGLENVEQKYFQDYVRDNQGREKFDLIILRHVLEHLKGTNKIIEDLKNLINPDGYLFLVVPNAAGFKPLKPLELNFEYGHVYSFTPFSLQQLLLRHGLKIVKWSFNYIFSLQIIATRIENPVNGVSMNELKQGMNTKLLYYKLINHDRIRNILRIKRKIKNLFGRRK